jgi:HEAT repeat protein
MSDTQLLQEIRKSDKKPKELLEYLSKLIIKDPSLINDYEVSLSTPSDSERGTCIESLEYVTQEKPEIALPHLISIISCLKDNAPRVKWEAARIIANISTKYPEKAAEAIDHLLINTKDNGTVVRWSTALALGEIMKSNKEVRVKLKDKIEKLVKEEENNGVKNVYIRALKIVNKT